MVFHMDIHMVFHMIYHMLFLCNIHMEIHMEIHMVFHMKNHMDIFDRAIIQVYNLLEKNFTKRTVIITFFK